MNATGVIETVASCQGHPAYGLPPYVYFKTTVNVAKAIEKRLREMSSADEFFAHWEIEGRFNQDYELMFLLYSPQYHRAALDSWFPAIRLLLSRRRIDADLSQLTEEIKIAVKECSQ
jgi:hypothetical protein